MKSKSKAKKKGIKSGDKKNKMKVKRNLNVDTKRATRTKVTSARRQKALRSGQNPQRRKTALKREIVVKKIQWKSRKI